jgi:hypothetical protein
MLSSNIKWLLICILSSLLNVKAYGQKQPSDSVYFSWPRLISPDISPRGKYATYCIEHVGSNRKLLTVKAIDNKWTKTFNCSDRFYNGILGENQLIFSSALDTVILVTLGKKEEYFTGYQSFKSAKLREGVFALWKSRELLVLNGEGRYIIDNVEDYNFVLNDRFLLLRSSNIIAGVKRDVLSLLDLANMERKVFWTGNEVSSLILDKSESKIAYLSSDSTNPRIFCVDLVTKELKSTEANLEDYNVVSILTFSKFGDNVILSLRSTISVTPTSKSVDLKVWRYTDENVLSATGNLGDNDIYGSFSLAKNRLVKLGKAHDYWWLNGEPKDWERRCFVGETVGDCSFEETFWNPSCSKRWFLVDISDGERFPITYFDGKTNLNVYYPSPDLHHIVFFDIAKQSYFSYSVADSTCRELSVGIARGAFNTQLSLPDGYIKMPQREIAGWDTSRNVVYIYDSYDVWKFDLTGRTSPEIITKGYGSKNKVIFSWALDFNPESIQSNLILNAFDTRSKQNGFYKLSVRSKGSPEKLIMGSYIYHIPFFPAGDKNGMKPLKSKLSNTFIVRREGVKEFPNYFLTKDFKKFDSLTNLHPENEFKWITSELHTWTLPDGLQLQGVLYKPADFDSTRKYPLVFNIYELLSNGLNAFIEPEPVCNGCNINPVLFASNGYLVFKPDIVYKADSAGESALQAVESAINHLSRFKWVDTGKIGIQGCSFGGFETNYIITHSTRIKAACAASGGTDLMGWASLKYRTVYSSFSFQQYRILSNFWDNPDPYIKNSPLFKAGNVVTPLLIFHTSVDDAVPFNQGVQFFLTLRRLRKPTWLLEYGGSANHGLVDKMQLLDFGSKVMGFFDYYLRDSAKPGWMDK